MDRANAVNFSLAKFLGIHMVQYIISEVQGYNVHDSMGNVSPV